MGVDPGSSRGDVVIYDAEGVTRPLREFLKRQGILHVPARGIQHRHVRLLDHRRLSET
jgi:hypothetical protein